VPNLKTDRTVGVPQGCAALNVRRLMYQSLIWSMHLPDHACRLRTAFDAKYLQGSADALVDGMGRDPELEGDFLGRPMLVDQ
jgi:hypothetical protein